MTREQIIAVSAAALKRTQEPGFAQTPVSPKHVKRFAELKQARMPPVQPMYVAPEKDGA